MFSLLHMHGEAARRLHVSTLLKAVLFRVYTGENGLKLVELLARPTVSLDCRLILGQEIA